MSQANVASISLGGTPTEQAWAWGDNIVINAGRFTRADGSAGELKDVALSHADASAAESPLDTTPLPVRPGVRGRFARADRLAFLGVELGRIDDPANADGIDTRLTRKLALMRQDMGVFGAEASEGLVLQRADSRVVDWFA